METIDNKKIPVPVPEVKKEEKEEITVKSIQEEILGVNDAGYSRSAIVAVLEKVHNSSKGFENLTEDDHEFVREVDVEYAKVDVYQFDEKIINLVLTFDSPDDVYLKELLDLFTQYRNCTLKANELLENQKDDDLHDVPLPVASITFLPLRYKGCAHATYANPIGYFRTLDENGINCQLHMLFNLEDVRYEVVDIDDDDLIDIQAGVMREMEIAENEKYNSSF